MGVEVGRDVITETDKDYFRVTWSNLQQQWVYQCFNGHFWEYVPISSVPPGFRAYLLIVGIT